ncbi:DJ-1 family glyoxalase III [Candidatus Marinarcus aquaticus]|uniref:DJ-1 family protein n=1 Tax=Candidatus Marinarcus aquaticus TaxID=2044504 RepID=A0A4Q0XN78_9BACT|nr:DJ-1 family glyoxalase III [Candidatus Marinarcus aquaticus]RXJ55466.1 DJ-1 family protein [Candidatus Marinarcus aquaticus]
MAKLLIPLANGFEEIEAVTIIDVNRRAGNEVIVCSIESTLEVLGANGITVKADTFIDALQTKSFDMIVLPGGAAGTQALSEHSTVQAFLKEFKKNNKLIGAICAAPYALDTAGVLNENYTCYPSFEKQITQTGYDPTQSVVIDKDVITSRGPGTALTFSLEIVKKLNGEETYNQLVEGMLVN